LEEINECNNKNRSGLERLIGHLYKDQKVKTKIEGEFS